MPAPADSFSRIVPFDSKARITPHTSTPLNWDSALLEYNGAADVNITRIKDDEYNIHISEIGLYTLDFQVSDENGRVYQKQFFIKAAPPLDWSGLDSGIKALEESYARLLKTMDAAAARQKVLEQANENPDFSAGLCGKALCIRHKGQITTILDLPDP